MEPQRKRVGDIAGRGGGKARGGLELGEERILGEGNIVHGRAAEEDGWRETQGGSCRAICMIP